MPPKPDLASHTLTSFLDRFVYRNAKAATGGPRGSSIMQPLSGGNNKGILLSSKSSSHLHQPVNTEAFWRKKAEDVAVDEVFFHKYFSQIGTSKKAPEKKKDEAGDNDEENEENEIWQALVESRPEVEGDGEDSDMEMLDLDEADMASSDDESEMSAGGSGENIGDSDLESADIFDGDTGSGNESEVGSDIDTLFAQELQTDQPATGEEEETSRAKKRRLKGLPTFASAEDYADMLDNDDDEDL